MIWWRTGWADEMTYTLWQTPHSLYSGKLRSYMIKKRIAFREAAPSDPRFAAEVLPKVGHNVIPVLETAQGEVWQDTTAIIDALDARHPKPAIVPPGPVQQVVAGFLDAFGSNYLLPLAMHYRWSYRDRQELFLRTEFARAIPQDMPYDQRLETAAKLMTRFAGMLGPLGVTAEVIPAMEAAYAELLAALEAHFRVHPYLLGGRPSIADFGMMAPLYAHLARDPVPAMLMRTIAPQVARWTERMNAAEVADPDYPEAAVNPMFQADDAIPSTLEAVLKVAFEQWTPGLAADAAAVDAWFAAEGNPPAGTVVSRQAKRSVHPDVGGVEYAWRGVTMRRASHVHSLWHVARAQTLADSLASTDRARLDALLERTGGTALMATRPKPRLVRESNVIVLG
jgi:glutathione S-transferase